LMECFGFVAAESDAEALERAKPAPVRRGKPAARKA
jgi:hypothetical protein